MTLNYSRTGYFRGFRGRHPVRENWKTLFFNSLLYKEGMDPRKLKSAIPKNHSTAKITCPRKKPVLQYVKKVNILVLYSWNWLINILDTLETSSDPLRGSTRNLHGTLLMTTFGHMTGAAAMITSWTNSTSPGRKALLEYVLLHVFRS